MPVLVLALAVSTLIGAGLATWKQDGLRARWSRHRFPRIILVSIDTLNVLYTDVHRPGIGLTPELLALAQAGVAFERAYAPVSITLPSHAAILTGREPAALGVMVNGDHLDDSTETLTEVLHRSGYRTGAVVSLGVLKGNFGVEQGFETYDDAIEEGSGRWYRFADEVVDSAIRWVDRQGDAPFFLWVHLSDPHEPYRAHDAAPDVRLLLDGEAIGDYSLASKERHSVTLRIPPGRHNLTWAPLREPRPDDRPSTALVLELLEREAWASYQVDRLAADAAPREVFLREPYGLGIANPGPGTIDLTLPFRGRINDPPTAEVIEAYRSEVAYADSQLGRLRRAIEERGLGGGTLWAIVSDHGEGLGHHGILGHATYAQEDHMRSLFVLTGPGIPAGVRVADALVALSDVAPTVLDRLSLRGLAAADGASRAGCWSRRGCSGREEYWVYGASAERELITAVAGYRGQHKILWQRNRRFAIHDLRADPTEETNLSDALRGDPGRRPADVTRLGAQFDRQREFYQQLLESRDQRLDPRHEEMLESLGYL